MTKLKKRHIKKIKYISHSFCNKCTTLGVYQLGRNFFDRDDNIESIYCPKCRHITRSVMHDNGNTIISIKYNKQFQTKNAVLIAREMVEYIDSIKE